ncbi:hypothetical protein CDCA_CDCA05G1669 [Cyanidium caldarium]|uniref:Uncharacterized protein n=1 Tax=Cyanidium caldarium TaxID=2771 RepID=A0AAV9ITS6_CYACA|nr:hypothetical protein CDCA_CDCA05G1669 [Cyanidium caldarium]
MQLAFQVYPYRARFRTRRSTRCCRAPQPKLLLPGPPPPPPDFRTGRPERSGDGRDYAFIIVRSLDPVFGFGKETLFIVNGNPYSLEDLPGPLPPNWQLMATRKITRARRIVSSALAFVLGLICWPLWVIAAAAFSTFAVVAAVVLFLAAAGFGVVFWALSVIEDRIEEFERYSKSKPPDAFL